MIYQKLTRCVIRDVVYRIKFNILILPYPQIFYVTLDSANGGANIGANGATAQIIIPANDEPYGTVSLVSQVINVTEEETDNTVSIPVQRR